MESLIRSGEKHMRGESTLTWGDESEECGDLPLTGDENSMSASELAPKRLPAATVDDTGPGIASSVIDLACNTG